MRTLAGLVFLSALLCAQGAWADDAKDTPKAADQAADQTDDKEPSVEELQRRIREKRKQLEAEREAFREDLETLKREPSQLQGRPLLRRRAKLKQKDLEWTVKRRNRLLEKAVKSPTKELKEQIEDLDEDIENIDKDLGRLSYIRLLGPLGSSFLRYEYHRNRDFTRRLDDNDQRVRMRLDAGFRAAAPGLGQVTAMGTLSRTWGANRNRDRQQDQLDLYEAYGELHLLSNENFEFLPAFGRIALNYSNQRLIGANSFFIFHRSFDGLRARLSQDLYDLDVFIARPVRRQDRDDRRFNDADWRENLLGMVFRFLPGPKRQVELFALRKQVTRRRLGERDPRPQASTIATFGLRAYQEHSSGIAVDAELYYQRGRHRGDSHESAAAALRLQYTHYYEGVPEDEQERYQPSLVAAAAEVPEFQMSLAIDWAKGDNRANDGRSQGFQAVYPSQHEFQGQADVLGFQNVVDMHAGLTYQWRSDIKDGSFSTASITVRGHVFRLDSTGDAVYDVNSQPFVRATGNRGSKDLGQELDVEIVLFDHLVIGAARFFPGRFLRGEGLNDPVDFFYVALR